MYTKPIMCCPVPLSILEVGDDRYFLFTFELVSTTRIIPRHPSRGKRRPGTIPIPFIVSTAISSVNSFLSVRWRRWRRNGGKVPGTFILYAPTVLFLFVSIVILFHFRFSSIDDWNDQERTGAEVKAVRSRLIRFQDWWTGNILLLFVSSFLDPFTSLPLARTG